MWAFNHLLYLLAENQGSTISVHSLAHEIGMSPKAVNRYRDILEQAYVNYTLDDQVSIGQCRVHYRTLERFFAGFEV